ncbi:MAG: glycine C-acetyltransferase [Candidatus Krumholzibacteria bacterium]|nr:glycine C-acetyltransferase [Candidatus Krumholzibacteria bacterium]MDH4337420.1 glycine C-acetyltransferase [Candidatus Krumholzibacteria bacterium]MDH5270913.1 glycine C-acetyltransferase [Candidatus Krumholzibacteria bacterium]MDH5627789.1 glycine C-acetyltransferase [Candidatus Krumholzibacteria bacterium]
MYGSLKDVLNTEIAAIREAGLYKDERIIQSAQAAAIQVAGGEVINFCANNYLGLSSHAKVVDAARKSLDTWGYGMSSVRFICGTQTIHKELEAAISRFLGTDDAILYSSCFDANGGLFETLLGAEDCIISDELNHASIIDGVRLCKAERMRYKNSDMNDLEKCLKEAQKHRLRMIATDGVFSMDGTIAKLKDICDLADKYHAIVMVDDSHATGFVGKTGRGTPEFNNVVGRVDLMTSTLGKAMGGASGGFTTGHKEIVEMLRQRSRPYLFSNSVAPPIVAASLAVVGLLEKSTDLRDRLEENTRYFRTGMTAAGFNIVEGSHPICPIMLGDARLAHDVAHDMLAEGIYVIGFSYPVVPKGKARIRVQISAGHSKEHLDRALAAFKKVGKKHKLVG